MTDNILHRGTIQVDDLAPDTDLVGLIRSLNDGGLEVPWMWSLTAGTQQVDHPEAFSFNVGINGAMGALNWCSNDGADLVPVDGGDVGEDLYRLAGLHESFMPPGAEVPIDTVYEAVAEFLLTRQRPTCVEWRPANRFGQRSDD